MATCSCWPPCGCQKPPPHLRSIAPVSEGLNPSSARNSGLAINDVNGWLPAAPFGKSPRSTRQSEQYLQGVLVPFFSNRSIGCARLERTIADLPYPCQVAIQGSHRYSEPLRSFRLRVSPTEHAAQPGQRRPGELLGPSAQPPPGANLRATVTLSSCSPTLLAHFAGGNRLFAHAPESTAESNWLSRHKFTLPYV